MTGDELRALRVGLRISQATMAEAIGVTRQQYMRYEKGARKRDDGTLAPVKVPGPVAKLAVLVKEGYEQWQDELSDMDEGLREAQDEVEEMQAARRAVEEEVEL